MSKIEPLIGITMGEPSGVGPEIILKSLISFNFRRPAHFLVIGDRFVIERTAAGCKIKVEKNKKRLLENVSFLDLNNVPHKDFRFGSIDPQYGKASIEYIQKAVELIKNKKIDALVTAPISKEAINRAGFSWPGHTEYLAHLTGTRRFAMMLVGQKLRVVLVTRHLPLAKVSSCLTVENVYIAIQLAHQALRRHFDLKAPRIGVSALNPHGGEGGLLGKEEEEIIRPAVLRANRKALNVEGPLSCDTVFLKTSKGEYDCIVAMYHDQGLIPLKMVASNRGINLTLGLPFVRTSPLHGTGLDIAGKAIASSLSMMEAIKLAYGLVQKHHAKQKAT